MRERVMLEAVHREGDRWVAELSFRGKRRRLVFGVDATDRLRPVVSARSPFRLTREGKAIGRLIDRARRGERLELPHVADPGDDWPGWPSAHDADWVDWTDTAPSAPEVWLDGAEQVGEGRWLARLRVDGNAELYEILFHPGPVGEEFRVPKAIGFDSYRYDLTGLLLRMNGGERFALPFQLRPRWPTPPDPPALP